MAQTITNIMILDIDGNRYPLPVSSDKRCHTIYGVVSASLRAAGVNWLDVARWQVRTADGKMAHGAPADVLIAVRAAISNGLSNPACPDLYEIA